ncbi:MAG: hypothetical protein WC967_15570 [Balneolaceae bacterium]
MLRFLTIILLLVSPYANAYLDMSKVGHNPRPDVIAEKLGMGITDDYVGLAGAPLATVKYICDTLPNGTSNIDGDTVGDGSLTAPYYSVAKVRDSMPTAEAGTVFAFCRGGTFYADYANSLNLTPNKGKRDYPIHVRDYKLPTGSDAMPVIINTTAGAVFYFTDSGDMDSEEGVHFQNLEFTGLNGGGNVIWATADTDYIIFENCYVHDTGGVASNTASVAWPAPPTSGNNWSIRRATEEVTDLVFTHNTATTGEIRDSITRTGGITLWPSSTRRGDGLIITGTVSNNGLFRVDDVSEDLKTVYLTKTVTDQIPGRAATYETWWNVVNETAPATGVFVDHRKTDGDSTGWIIRNNTFENIPGGNFINLSRGMMYNNEFINNGFARAVRDHHIYISSTKGNAYIFNNYLHKNAHFKGIDPNGAGTFAGGKCEAAQLVGHGRIQGVEIFDNYLTEDSDEVGGNCWAISLNAAYSTAEYIHNLHVHDNIIHNFSQGIGCGSCSDVIIENNILYSDITSYGASNGIVVPDMAPGTGDDLLGNVTIRNNTIYGIIGSSTTATGSKGISVSPTDAGALGTFLIENNTIKNWYKCVNDGHTGVNNTVTITGNDTSTGCTTGLQP